MKKGRKEAGAEGEVGCHVAALKASAELMGRSKARQPFRVIQSQSKVTRLLYPMSTHH